MIKLIKVNKYFNRFKKNKLHVINNTSLEFENTGLVAILGESGSGKTTLLNAIGGLDKVSSGKIYVNGKKITRKRSGRVDKIRNLNIGYIFQNYNLINDLTVFENVALALKMSGLKNKEEIKKRVNYILEVLGIYKYRNRYANMISGGERQRVAIARALVKNPNIIIADEPTGNLDSKNSLEIMNIIKAISKTKLVILVTHEKNLAEFYATRIIEVVDGTVVNDRKNEHNDELDYRLESKIYLKEFEDIKKINEENLNVDVYKGKNEKLDIKLVLKNGNIYVEAKNNKVEVIDDSSAIELIDDHYKKISKEEYEKNQFHYDDIIKNTYKKRYSSIYNPITLFTSGFKKIYNYSVLKKLLLLGFLASSMFSLYAVSNIFGVTNITDDEFIKMDKNYITLITDKINVEDYYNYEKLDFVDYIIPGNTIMQGTIKYDDYYQTQHASDSFTFSLASLNLVKENNLIYGKMPEKENEVIVDKMVLEKITSESYNSAKQVGIKDISGFLNREICVEDFMAIATDEYTIPKLVIVGICDLKSPSLYINNNSFVNLLANGVKGSENGTTSLVMGDTNESQSINQNLSQKIYDVNLAKDKIELTKGRMPENDYEIIVNEQNKYEMKLNKTIKDEINGNKLKVVGYYKSKENLNNYYTTLNTIKIKLITDSKNISIYPKDKMEALNYFREKGLNIEDTYQKTKTTYVEGIKEKIISTLVLSGIILAVSLVEIFLMIRSSFLSRVKEVGILRAIGVKKIDIYKMFLGEILAITIITAIPGILIMSNIIKGLQMISYYQNQFMLNGTIIGISLVIIFAFNIIVGLLPVHNVIKKAPARILSRNDVD